MKSPHAFRYAVLIVLGYVITTVSNVSVFNMAEKVEASSGCPPLDGAVKG